MRPFLNWLIESQFQRSSLRLFQYFTQLGRILFIYIYDTYGTLYPGAYRWVFSDEGFVHINKQDGCCELACKHELVAWPPFYMKEIPN